MTENIQHSYKDMMRQLEGMYGQPLQERKENENQKPHQTPTCK